MVQQTDEDEDLTSGADDGVAAGAGAAGGAGGLRQVYDAMPPERRRFVLLGGGAALAGLLFIVISSATAESWKPAARNLMPEDQEAVMAALEAEQIEFKVADGGTLLVLESDLPKARLQLALNGSAGGREVGFEIFNEAEMGRSAFSERVNYHRALEGELARSIKHLRGVERVRVHLVLPARRVFKEHDVAPSASVVLQLKRGFDLDGKRGIGIRRLVSAAVERLKPEAVSIVDQYGNVLGATEATAEGGGGAFKQKHKLEHDLEERVVSLLEPVVGVGRVRAQISMDMDFSKLFFEQETFDPEGQVVRSEHEIVETSNSVDPIVGGPPGSASNLPSRPDAQTGESKNKTSMKETNNTLKNYDIDRTLTRKETPTARLERLSVAVLLDERFEADGKTRVPYTESELDRYRQLVSTAVGIDTRRGDQVRVDGMAFTPRDLFEEPVAGGGESPAPEAIPWWIIAAGAGGLLLVTVIIMALRGRKKRRRDDGSEDDERLDLVVGGPGDALLPDSATGEPEDWESEVVKNKIRNLRERAVKLGQEDIRRLVVVFERWFELDRESDDDSKKGRDKDKDKEKAA